MKFSSFYYFLLGLFVFVCSANNVKTNNYDTQNTLQCDSVYYSARMREIASNFQPFHLNFNMSIPTDMKEFLSYSKNSCITNNKEYDFFMSAILLKMAIYHAEEAKVSFDLNGMKDTYTILFIEGLRNRINNPILTEEAFSSYAISTFVRNNQQLKSDPYIKNLLTKFDILIDGIVNKK
jgi:hypothetical protein